MFGLEMFGKIQEVIEELDPEDIKSKIKLVVDSVIEMRERQERIERKLDALIATLNLESWQKANSGKEGRLLSAVTDQVLRR
jgi:hypothetical protein